MKRLLAVSFATLAALIAVVIPLLVLSLVFIIATESGTRFVWNQAQSFLPEGLSIESLEGRLAGPLQLHNLVFNTEYYRLELDNAEFEWTPSLLAQRKLDIERFVLSGLRYTQLKPSPPKLDEPSEPIQLPEQIELPVAIRLGEVAVKDVQFISAPDAEPFIVNSAILRASARLSEIEISELNVDSPLFGLTGNTRLVAQWDYPIDGEFHFHAPVPDYPEIKGKTQINGSLKSLVIDQTLAAPYNVTAKVRVNEPLAALTFDAAVDVPSLQLQALNKDLPAVTLTLGVAANGSPENIDYSLDSHVVEPEIGAFDTTAKGNFKQQTVTLEQLRISIPDEPAVILAKGMFHLDETQALSLDANWEQLQWPLKDEALVNSPKGQLNVSGTLKNILAKLDMQLGDLQVPAQLQADSTINLEGEQPDLDASLNWSRLQWPFNDEPLITSPQGTIKLTGTPQDLLARLDIAMGDEGRIEGTAERNDEVLNVALDWRNLQWPLNNPRVLVPSGNVSVNGRPEDYTLDVMAKVDVPGQTGAELNLKGKGSQEALDLSLIDVQALSGSLTGTANVAWKPDIQGKVNLKGQGLNPGELLKDWPGSLGLSLQAEGGMVGDKPRVQLDQLKAVGELRGYNLALNAKGAFENDVATLDTLAFSSGSSELNASGTVSETLNVDWNLSSADLGTLLPDASGRIQGTGKLSGPAQRPLVVAKLSASDLKYQAYLVNSLDLNGNVDVNGEQHSTLTLAIDEAKAAGVDVKQISLEAEGNAASHTLSLLADTSTGEADLALQGGLTNLWQAATAWDFQMDRATLKYPELDAWALRSPAKGRVSADQASLSQSCWQSSGAALCLEGEQSAAGLKGEFNLTDLPFGYFASLLPPDLSIQGNLSGNGRVNKSPGGEPAAVIDLQTTSTQVNTVSSIGSEDEPPVNTLIVEFLPGNVHAQLEDGGIDTRVNLPLSETDGFELMASIPPGAAELTQRPLSGHITSNIQDLSFIADLIPAVQELQGRVEGDMRLAGSIASPVLDGRFALVDGAAKLDEPGLDIKDILVELTGKGDGGILMSAHAASGKGEMNVDGSADFRGAGPVANIHVKGENFRVINTQEAKVDVSPNLMIAMREESINVEGEVLIPKTNINLKTLPESATQVSADQIIIDENYDPEVNEDTGKNINARVRLILGDKVRFKGFGLSARFEGDILAIEKPGEPTTASGELRIVDGEYRAYGQGLVIEKGRILFAGGPISQPGLDVRAIRKPAEDITVGVQVRGSLKQPDFTLFSDPGMTQGNQLSYLVLGRPLGGASDSEGSALSRAALALGLKGGSSITGKIGSKLGLDEFGVESGEAGSPNQPDQASFVIGKYLSPKLYVSYGLGLFDPISTVRLQYAISSKWKLVTESSGIASGGDVIYTIESGK